MRRTAIRPKSCSSSWDFETSGRRSVGRHSRPRFGQKRCDQGESRFRFEQDKCRGEALRCDARSCGSARPAPHLSSSGDHQGTTAETADAVAEAHGAVEPRNPSRIHLGPRQRSTPSFRVRFRNGARRRKHCFVSPADRRWIAAEAEGRPLAGSIGGRRSALSREAVPPSRR